MGLTTDKTLQKKTIVTMKTLSKMKTINPPTQNSRNLKHKKENYKIHHNKILKTDMTLYDSTPEESASQPGRLKKVILPLPHI